MHLWGIGRVAGTMAFVGVRRCMLIPCTSNPDGPIARDKENGIGGGNNKRIKATLLYIEVRRHRHSNKRGSIVRRSSVTVSVGAVVGAMGNKEAGISPNIRSSISTIDHRSSIIDHRPSTIDHRSSIIDHRHSTFDHRHSTFDLWATKVQPSSTRVRQTVSKQGCRALLEQVCQLQQSALVKHCTCPPVEGSQTSFLLHKGVHSLHRELHEDGRWRQQWSPVKSRGKNSVSVHFSTFSGSSIFVAVAGMETMHSKFNLLL
jgi:hypothetical protein